MIWEARLAFILFFFLCWAIVGLVPWTAATAAVRGRGALLALPLALAAACAAGVFVPLIGLRDFSGFLVSLLTAAIGGTAGAIGGITFDRRLQRGRPVSIRRAVDHPLGSSRPPAPATPRDEATPPTVT